MDVNSIDEFYDELKSITESSMIIVAERVKTLLYDYVDTNWYKAHTPKMYERTRQLIESLTISEVVDMGDELEIKVFFDVEKIKAIEVGGDEEGFDSYAGGEKHWNWNKHMSITGEDVSESIPYFIEEGNGESPLHQYEGIHMVRETMEYCESTQEILKTLKRVLEINGVECS